MINLCPSLSHLNFPHPPLCIVIYDGHWQETDMRARTSTCHSQQRISKWPQCIGMQCHLAGRVGRQTNRFDHVCRPPTSHQPTARPNPSSHPHFDGCSWPVVIGDCQKGQLVNCDAVDKVPRLKAMKKEKHKVIHVFCKYEVL